MLHFLQYLINQKNIYHINFKQKLNKIKTFIAQLILKNLFVIVCMSNMLKLFSVTIKFQKNLKF